MPYEWPRVSIETIENKARTPTVPLHEENVCQVEHDWSFSTTEVFLKTTGSYHIKEREAGGTRDEREGNDVILLLKN